METIGGVVTGDNVCWNVCKAIVRRLISGECGRRVKRRLRLGC